MQLKERNEIGPRLPQFFKIRVSAEGGVEWKGKSIVLSYLLVYSSSPLPLSAISAESCKAFMLDGRVGSINSSHDRANSNSNSKSTNTSKRTTIIASNYWHHVSALAGSLMIAIIVRVTKTYTNHTLI